jgi:hypothetical protein
VPSVLSDAQRQALAALVAAWPDVATLRSNEAETVAARRADAEAIVAAGVGGRLVDGGPQLGPESVAQAEAYLGRTDAEHVQDGLSHTLFNLLRAPRVTTSAVPTRTAKLDILNRFPSLVDAEVVWRQQAATDMELATWLAYWDRLEVIDASSPFAQKILGGLVRRGIATQAMVQEIAESATVMREVAGPSTLDAHELGAATVADVRDAVAALAGGG